MNSKQNFDKLHEYIFVKEPPIKVDGFLVFKNL